MVCKQLAVILHRILSVKCDLNRNRKSHLRFNKEIDRHLGEIRKKRRKERWLFAAMAHVVCQNFRERSLWVRPSNQAWFDTEFDEQQWYENFPVTRDTFQFILNEIEREITRRNTPTRRAISARRRLAIGLYYLSSTAGYRTIANLFGVSTSFVCSCIKEVSTVIVQKMKTKFITVPKGEEVNEIMRIYKDK